MTRNYSNDSGFRPRLDAALATQTDNVFDEGGFTNYGTKGQNVTTPQKWRRIVDLIRAVQANDGCYAENGEEPGPSKQITEAERLWVANWLLTRDDCTYDRC